MSHHPDPRRHHRGGVFAPPVDALAAAVRLDLATSEMREHARQAGPAPAAAPVDPLDDEPPTGLLDLGAIRAAVAAGPIAAEHRIDPAAAAWLAGAKREDAFAAGRIVDQLDQLDEKQPEPEPEPEPEPLVEPEPPEPVTSPPPPAPASFSSERGRVLDWRSRHDEASRAFPARGLLAGSAPLTDHLWPVGATLDQKSDGACVGFGITDALNARASGDRDRTAADALELYRRAQRLDEIPGEDYSGTSVLAGLKAAKAEGLMGSYRWCFGTADIAQAVLQAGPVVVGIPVLSGMFDTAPGGLWRALGTDTGQGHCLAVVGLRMKGPQGQPGPFFILQNSWGSGWGDRGLAYMHHRDLAGLLHGVGEAALPIVGAR